MSTEKKVMSIGKPKAKPKRSVSLDFVKKGDFLELMTYTDAGKVVSIICVKIEVEL